MSLRIGNADGLIVANIQQREETYFLVTEDKINSVKSKAVFSDVFISLSSLIWGAYLSVIASIAAISPPNNNNDPAVQVLIRLNTMSTILCVFGIIFTVLLVWTYYLSYKEITRITTSSEIVLNAEGNLRLRDIPTPPSV